MSSNAFNKVAIVTGAASGIGKAIAKRLVDEGAKVAIVDINKEGGENYARELNESKSSKVAIFQYADISNFDELAGAFETTHKTFGKIDIVINNAAIAIHAADLWNSEENHEAISRLVDVNVKGVIFGTKLAIKYLLKNGEEGGCIINSSSVAGYVPSQYSVTYAATKGGVLAFSRSAALGSAKINICIGVVCPSFTDTPMFSEKSRKLMPDKLFVDMKDVVESYFKFINDPKGLNGATISPLYTDNIVIEKLEDKFSAQMADANENSSKLFEVLDKRFDENVKKMREN